LSLYTCTLLLLLLLLACTIDTFDNDAVDAHDDGEHSSITLYADNIGKLLSLNTSYICKKKAV